MNRTISIFKYSKKSVSSSGEPFGVGVPKAKAPEKLKRLSLSKKYKTAGRNNSGTITAFHRGGGSKRLFRKMDLKRALLSTGIVETVEYDPNRSSFLALVRWVNNFDLNCTNEQLDSGFVATNFCGFPNNNSSGFVQNKNPQKNLKKTLNGRSCSKVILSYILACDQLKIGQIIHNIVDPFSTERFHNAKLNQSLWGTSQLNHESLVSRTNRLLNKGPVSLKKTVVPSSQNHIEQQSFSQLSFLETPSPNSAIAGNFLEAVPSSSSFVEEGRRIGNSIPLQYIPVGTLIHNIELNPNQGGKLVRAAGTFAQLVYVPTIATSTVETHDAVNFHSGFETLSPKKKPLLCFKQHTEKCVIRLPSGITKQLDMRCCATVGVVSNTNNETTRKSTKKTKAGQNRWLGKRPVVRGVAMNPVDHPHGGGEGRTKGGRPSVSPWGKLTKGGFKTSRSKK